MKKITPGHLLAIFTIILILSTQSSVNVLATDIRKGSGNPLFSESFLVANDSTIPAQAVTRSRYVNVNFEEMGTAEAPLNNIVLNLFDDTVYTAILEHTESGSPEATAWIGRLEGIPLSQVVLIKANGVLSGSVAMPHGIYEIRPITNDVYIIEDIDQALFPEELEPVHVPDGQPDLDDLMGDLSGASDSCTDISVLVAYSPEARAAAGSTAAIEALIAQAVAETNQSYVNSGLTQRINLVHTMETGAGDSQNDFYNDLYALLSLTDGRFDSVDAARETYYADEVALIIEDYQYCGLAFVNSSASSAFSVTARNCATGYFSFGHELGHNMGARHDWYVDVTANSHKGFVNTTDHWRTIMAYSSHCGAAGTYCTRIQYWSNPNVFYNSDPMGISTSGPMNCNYKSLSPNPSSCAADNRSRLTAPAQA